MRKKIIAFMLGAVMVLTLAACGTQTPKSSAVSGKEGNSQALGGSAERPSEPTSAVSADPTDAEPSGAGDDGQGGFSDLADFMIEDGVLVHYFGSGGDVRIPDGVTQIGRNVFDSGGSRGSLGLTGVYIPDSVTQIGDSAFAYCSSLASVYIPDGVTGIGDYAFQNCSSLTSVYIPDSMTQIGEMAFYGCSSLASVYIPERFSDEELSIFAENDKNGNRVMPATLTINRYTTPPPRVDDRPARPER